MFLRRSSALIIKGNRVALFFGNSVGQLSRIRKGINPQGVELTVHHAFSGRP